MPTISIIIPIYNVAPYIAVCLQSVMRQTYAGPMECLLVDDRGTDNSMEVVQQMIAGYDGPIAFKVLHHEHNKGLSAARNTGMEAATGEYVYFLDSDDWISDDCIEKLAKPLRDERVDVVVGKYEHSGTDSKAWVLPPEGLYRDKDVGNISRMYEKVYPMVWNKLFREEFLEKNNLRFEVGKIHEDQIFGFDLGCFVKSYYVVDAVTYFYRYRENSIMTKRTPLEVVENYLRCYQSVREHVAQRKGMESIYDLYMSFTRRLFWRISKVEMDDEMIGMVQKRTNGFLDLVPGFRYLSNKHDRLVYAACYKDQTYLRYQYVTQVFANQLRGRVVRNLLAILPTKKQ